MFYAIVCDLVWHKSLKSIGQVFAREHITVYSWNGIIFSLSLPKSYSSQFRTSISEAPVCNVSPKFAHLTSLLDQTSQLPPETLARLLCSQHYLSFNNDVSLSGVVPDWELVYTCSPWVSWFFSSSSLSRFCPA